MIARQTPLMIFPLAVDEYQAAAMLGISERTLWEYRNSGEIPIVRIGRLVRYSVDDLRKFIESKRVEKLPLSNPKE